jgi:3-hydroxymyristoyl/3-hydroxydecanoyl-(acyl carrier protein) dehydratase
VVPGDCLRIETRKLTQAANMAYIEGTITMNGEKVASGELSVAWG